MTGVNDFDILGGGPGKGRPSSQGPTGVITGVPTRSASGRNIFGVQDTLGKQVKNSTTITSMRGNVRTS